MSTSHTRRARDNYGVLTGGQGHGPVQIRHLPAGYQISSDEFGLALRYRGKIIRTSAVRENLVKFAAQHAAA